MRDYDFTPEHRLARAGFQWNLRARVFRQRIRDALLDRVGLTDYSIRKFREALASLPRVISAEVEFAYSFHCLGLSITPIQERTEVTTLLQVLESMHPSRVLEIGTWNGGTLFLFSRVSTPTASIVSIDVPASLSGGGYASYRSELYRSFASPGQELHLILGNSHKSKTRNLVQDALRPGKLDFLFIDADHSYEGVRHDFEMYSPLVKSGGLVAFHDVTMDSCVTGIEVKRFWKEIKDNYSHREIVTFPWKRWGIGLLWV